MSGYRHGILIHNFNEDQFGVDLQTNSSARGPAPPLKSISHLAHDWKTPVPQDGVPPASTECVQRHLLLGHAGDMSDPRTNLQKTEHATASQYFMQHPSKVSHGQLSANGFTLSEEPLKLAGSSVIANAIRARWGDGGRSHAMTARDMYKTDYTHGVGNSQDGSQSERYARPYSHFTGGFDSVKLSR